MDEIEIEVDELDRRLLHAIQIEPRASWAALAPILGADATTLTRRWHRLRQAGIAWTTGIIAPRQNALIEIVCVPAKGESVVEHLRNDRRVIMLDYTSGSRDLMATVAAHDLPALADYALHVLGRREGVQSMRLHLANEVLIDGSNWRIRALSDDEAARIPSAGAPRARAPRRIVPELRNAIEEELWKDGRATAKAIADRHSFAPQRVTDAIAVMRETGQLRVRTDVARAYSGWPVSAWYFLEIPAQSLASVRTTIARIPEVRMAVSTASQWNLTLLVWLRNLADVTRFEIALEKVLGGASIADRSVVLRALKHLGREVLPDTRVVDTPLTGSLGRRDQLDA